MMAGVQNGRLYISKNGGDTWTETQPIDTEESDDHGWYPMSMSSNGQVIVVAEKPKGRLLVLEGPPGTGKSYFIRNIVTSCAQKANFILLDYKSASSVSGAELLNVLLNFQNSHESYPLVFIIEDADHFLHARDENNINVISSLLNMTDGILGDALDLRIIASTNISLNNIETALTRNGRLLEHLSFESLTPERAQKLYFSLTNQEKEFSKPIPLCDIYAFTK
jgi:SpoVK/Ycf46/Vps4 family AAA+-type ATPase